MESIVWLLIAGILCLNERNKTLQVDKRKIVYFLEISGAATCIGSLFLCTILNIDHLSIWLAISYILLALQGNYLLLQWIFEREKRADVLLDGLKTAIGCLILAVYFKSLASRTIGVEWIGGKLPTLTVARVTVVILLTTGLWIYGDKLLRKNEKIRDFLNHMLLILTPVILFGIIELSWNPEIIKIDLFSAGINIIICLFAELFFYNLFRVKLIGMSFVYILAWAIGALNHFVYTFRGQPIILTDFFVAKTAMSVAGQYEYRMTDGIGIAFLIMFFIQVCISMLRRTERSNLEKRTYVTKNLSVALATSILFGVWVGNVDFEKTYHIYVDFWT